MSGRQDFAKSWFQDLEQTSEILLFPSQRSVREVHWQVLFRVCRGKLRGNRQALISLWGACEHLESRDGCPPLKKYNYWVVRVRDSGRHCGWPMSSEIHKQRKQLFVIIEHPTSSDVAHVNLSGIGSQNIWVDVVFEDVDYVHTDKEHAIVLFKRSQVEQWALHSLFARFFVSHNRSRMFCNFTPFESLSHWNGLGIEPKPVMHAEQMRRPTQSIFIPSDVHRTASMQLI